MKRTIISLFIITQLLNISCSQVENEKSNQDSIANEGLDFEKDAHLLADIGCYINELGLKEAASSFNNAGISNQASTSEKFSDEEKVVLAFLIQKNNVVEKEIYSKYQEHPAEKDHLSTSWNSYKKNCTTLDEKRKSEILETLKFEDEKEGFTKDFYAKEKKQIETKDSVTKSIQDQFKNAFNK